MTPAPNTDLATMQEMLDRAGIAYTIEKAERSDAYSGREAGMTIIVMSADDQSGGKVFGYLGFIAELRFTPDGRLHSAGAWE